MGETETEGMAFINCLLNWHSKVHTTKTKQEQEQLQQKEKLQWSRPESSSQSSLSTNHK